MMITQERPLGCDDSTIEMLTKLDTKVSLISKSVQFIYNTSHQTIQKIQSLITEEKKTNEEQNEDKNENKNENEETTMATLTSVKMLLRNLSKTSHLEFPFHIKSSLENIKTLLLQLGPSAHDEEKNVLETIVPDDQIILKPDWINIINTHLME